MNQGLSLKKWGIYKSVLKKDTLGSPMEKGLVIGRENGQENKPRGCLDNLGKKQ